MIDNKNSKYDFYKEKPTPSTSNGYPNNRYYNKDSLNHTYYCAKVSFFLACKF